MPQEPTLALQRASSVVARSKGVFLVVAGILLGAVASARASSLVNGLYLFIAGEPARASEINHNFVKLTQADVAAGLRADASEARIAALEAKLNRVPVTWAQGARIHVPKAGSIVGWATCPAGTHPISGVSKPSHPECAAVQEEYIQGNSWHVRVRQAFCMDSGHGGINVDITAMCIPTQ